MGTSNIDVTLTTQDLVDNVRNWRIRTDITDNDHRVIFFTLLLNQDVTVTQTRERKRFNVDKADWVSFKEKLAINISRHNISGTIEETAP